MRRLVEFSEQFLYLFGGKVKVQFEDKSVARANDETDEIIVSTDRGIMRARILQDAAE